MGWLLYFSKCPIVERYAEFFSGAENTLEHFVDGFLRRNHCVLLPCDAMQVCGVFSIGWSAVSSGGGGSLGPGWTVLVVVRSAECRQQEGRECARLTISTRQSAVRHCQSLSYTGQSGANILPAG